MQRIRFHYRPSTILALAGLLLPWGMTNAATDTDTFDVTVTVIAACDISAADHDFGTYDALSPTPLDSTSTISVTCTSGASYSVALNAGTTGGGTIPSRLMTDGSNTLSYNLYTNAGYGTVWGDGTGGSAEVTGTGSGASQNLTVYGRMPAGQGEPAGDYSDTVTATITY
ncbi:spore coat U domain-containing protein [Hyphomonas oceanitis]|uniref:Csu type fimbrial protein n=1 Tax=Hyphomonas oceanitis TaxID=81033 RepID=UPI0030016651